MTAEFEFQIEDILENISDQILQLKLDDIPGAIKMLPEEFREGVIDIVRDVYYDLNWVDNIEYEDGEREEIINNIKTQLKSFYKLLQIWKLQNEASAAA